MVNLPLFDCFGKWVLISPGSNTSKCKALARPWRGRRPGRSPRGRRRDERPERAGERPQGPKRKGASRERRAVETMYYYEPSNREPENLREIVRARRPNNNNTAHAGCGSNPGRRAATMGAPPTGCVGTMARHGAFPCVPSSHDNPPDIECAVHEATGYLKSDEFSKSITIFIKIISDLAEIARR